MNGGTSLRKRAAAILALTGAALALATPAHAVGEAISVDPSTVEPGGTLTITGSGWTCAADVDLFIDGSPVGSVLFVDIVAGGFTVAVDAPDAEGDYLVSAEYGFDQTSTGCDGEASDPFTVVGSTTTSSSTTSTTSSTTSTTSTTTTTTTEAPTTSERPTTTEATTTTTQVDAEGPTTTTGSGGGGGPVSTLPVTGSSTTSTVAPFALLVLAAGGLLVVVSRRRTAA